MKKFIYLAATILLILATSPLLATTLNIECEISKIYTNEIVSKANAYITNHPGEDSITYSEAVFIVKPPEDWLKSHVELSIDSSNNRVIDNLTGFIALNDITLKLTEYTDQIFIEYAHRKKSDNDIDFLVEKIVINRKTGEFNGQRYISDISAEAASPPYRKGELSYYMSGRCKSLKRLF